MRRHASRRASRYKLRDASFATPPAIPSPNADPGRLGGTVAPFVEPGNVAAPSRLTAGTAPGAVMLKYAIIFLIISLIAGALGLTNVSAIAKRISLLLFGLFFVVFLILLGFALLVEKAIDHV